MKKLVLILLPLLLIVFGSASAESDSKPLNGKQVLALVKGNTAEGVKFRSQVGNIALTVRIPYKTYFRADGVLLEKGEGGGESESLLAHGTWWVKKGKLCFQVRDSLRDTGKKCKRVVPTGEGGYELQDKNGNKTHTWDRVVDGNPYGFK